MLHRLSYGPNGGADRTRTTGFVVDVRSAAPEKGIPHAPEQGLAGHVSPPVVMTARGVEQAACQDPQLPGKKT